MKDKKAGIPKKKKIIKITKQMKEKIKKHREFFEGRTVIQATYEGTPCNGFMGCGILKEAANHLMKKANLAWLYGPGMNQDGTDIVKVLDVELTFNELKRFRQIIDLVIENYESQIRGEKLDVIEEELREKASMDKNLTFKIEKR